MYSVLLHNPKRKFDQKTYQFVVDENHGSWIGSESSKNIGIRTFDSCKLIECSVYTLHGEAHTTKNYFSDVLFEFRPGHTIKLILENI